MSIALLKNERKDLILRQVNIHTRVTFSDLSSLTHVSEDTIRRDLNELASEGRIIKVRGGAMVSTYHLSATPTNVYAIDNKKNIARKALTLIQNGMFVLIGGGTTVRELIRLIPESLNATFITPNPVTVMDLLEKPNIETIMIGGKMSSYSQMAVGGDVTQKLAEIKTDLCIMGTNALDANNGLTDSDWDSVQVKKTMMKSAEKTIILTISEKLNATMRFKIADLSEVDYLITELNPSDTLLQSYTEGVIVL
ncbi:MAG: DeoR/GlpR transcriptional regulator [Saprospiraceae bacterium]|nr:DeoR/GlpR transcriptional regulator [Saprospiraceae bacterium]